MDEAYRRAKKKVKNKKEFYKELGVFLPMAIGLMLLNIFTIPHYFWFLWAVLPWGITIIIKGVKLGVENKTESWEDREIRKELRAMGKDPDDYIDSPLELIDVEPKYELKERYKDSDFV